MTYTFNLLELILIPIFIILFTVLIMLLSKEKNLTGIDIFYGITASILAVMLGSFIIIILLFLFTDLASIYETKKTLDAHTKIFFSFITPTGIMLSAALASLSVLKNIKNTNMIEKSKEKKEKEETKARLEFYLSDLKQLLVAYKDLKTYAHIDVATRIIIKIQKNLDNDKKIISQFSKTKLTDLSYDMHVISSLEALNNIDTNNSVVSKELLKVVKETLTSMEKNMNILEKENNLLITKNH